MYLKSKKLYIKIIYRLTFMSNLLQLQAKKQNKFNTGL